MITLMRKIRLNAFTLAEVLLTLGIIGIVAAMTIPTLMNNTNDRATISKINKAYSTLSQAVMSMIADGTTMASLFTTVNDPMPFYNLLIPKLSVLKNCGQASTGCIYNGQYKTLNNGPWDDFQSSTYATAILSDGMSIIVYGPTVANCKWSAGDKCTAINVDVNGAQQPNVLGRDVFQFWVTENGVVPFGAKGDPPTTTCSLSSSGQGCAGKIIMESAINYLP